MGILGAKLDVILDQIRTIQPKTYIEVGCYRCETMKEVAALGVPRLIGFDMFVTAPASEEPPLDGPPITYEEAQKFGFELIKGDSAETLTFLDGVVFDGPIVAFIDGGHSFKTALNDIKLLRKYQPNAILLVDDISMHGVRMALEASGLKWDVVGLETARFTPL